MAGVVSSEGVFENDLSFSLTPNEDTESLQDLIDSELALRSQEPIEEPAPKAVESFSTEFLVAERNHSELCNGNKAEEEEQLLVDLSSEAPLSPEPEEVAAPSQDPVPPSPPLPETAKTLSLDNENFFSFDAENNEAKPGIDSTEPLVPVILESKEPPPEPVTPPQSTLIEEPPSPRVLEMNLHNLNLSAVETIETIETNGVHLTTNEDSWTTVEEAARDMLDASSPVTETITYTNYSEETETIITEKKSKKKKSITTESGEATTTKTKKTKKSKKSEEKENHISVKSSFSKFDQLSKKDVFHVRSSDPAKAQKTFNQSPGGESQTASCKSCGKTVFAMEQIKAERAVWHKNCFRCKTCNKQLTLDIYSSHEGLLYCKPHFKELFQPKAVVETEEEPASDKVDLGLEELSSLNVKSRFQVFEKQETSETDSDKLTQVNVKRSPSILSKLARFQKKGMDIGVTDESLNGFVYEESSSSEEEEGDEEVEEAEQNGVIKCRKIRERPVSFSKMGDVKKNWETGQAARRDELREKSKQDIQHIRSRMFMGHQGKMKEMYEQAVAESETKANKKDVDDIVRSEKAKIVREKFEKGEAVHSDEEDANKQKLDEDMSVFEEGISKKSRSLFLEMDANAAKVPVVAPTPKPAVRETTKKVQEVYMSSRQTSEDIVKASDTIEDIAVETADLSSKFRFFETYKAPEIKKKSFRITPPRDGQVKSESPEREIYRDPDVVRADDRVDDEQVVMRSQTASKMLTIFRQLEEQKEVLPDGPKPKKCFTPPPDYKDDKSGSSEEESEEESEEDEEEEDEESEDENGIIRSSHKIKDEFLEQARNAAKAKALAAKFESWEPEKHSGNNAINMLESDNPSIDSTKSLRAHFESLKIEQPKEKSRPKVNRFV